MPVSSGTAWSVAGFILAHSPTHAAAARMTTVMMSPPTMSMHQV